MNHIFCRIEDKTFYMKSGSVNAVLNLLSKRRNSTTMNDETLKLLKEKHPNAEPQNIRNIVLDSISSP